MSGMGDSHAAPGPQAQPTAGGDPVKQPSNDDERLAALLDGRVRAGEREELLARLSEGGGDYAVFTQTASILRRLEAEDAAAPLRLMPFRRSGARPWPARSRLVAFAAVVAVLAVTGVWMVRRQGVRAGDPVRLAVLVDPARRGLPEGALRALPWEAERGGTAIRGVSGPAGSVQAARAGVLLMRLSVAAHAGDTAATRTLADRLRSLYEPAGGRTALRQISDRPDAPRDSLAKLISHAAASLGKVLGWERLELGAWTEAAHLGLQRREAAFFQSRESKAVLRRATQTTEPDSTVQAAAASVQQALTAGAEPRWEALGPRLDALREAITN